MHRPASDTGGEDSDAEGSRARVQKRERPAPREQSQEPQTNSPPKKGQITPTLDHTVVLPSLRVSCSPINQKWFSIICLQGYYKRWRGDSPTLGEQIYDPPAPQPRKARFTENFDALESSTSHSLSVQAGNRPVEAETRATPGRHPDLTPKQSEAVLHVINHEDVDVDVEEHEDEDEYDEEDDEDDDSDSELDYKIKGLEEQCARLTKEVEFWKMTVTAATRSPSHSPRLPSPPPFPEVQFGPQSPTSSIPPSTINPEIEDASKIDKSATRRIRPGTKAAEMAYGPPLVPLSEVEMAFILISRTERNVKADRVF
ncbi:MAG: hypothetical protein Q9190_005534 [Brigantiaea leucoxantha]